MNTIEIRLTTPHRLNEALALPADAIGIGQEGCLAKLPANELLRDAANKVREAGRTIVLVAPIAWPRTAAELHARLLAVADDGPTTITVNDIGTALAIAAADVKDCTIVAGLGLTRGRPHSADLTDSAPLSPNIDTSLMTSLGEHGVTAIEVDTETNIGSEDNPWQVRQLVDAVPLAYGRSCPTARYHKTGPPNCQALCDISYEINVNSRWQLNHGHREPVPAGTARPTLTVWGNAVYQPATAEPTAGYRIIDARWHTVEQLAENVHKQRENVLIGR